MNITPEMFAPILSLLFTGVVSVFGFLLRNAFAELKGSNASIIVKLDEVNATLHEQGKDAAVEAAKLAGTIAEVAALREQIHRLENDISALKVAAAKRSRNQDQTR